MNVQIFTWTVTVISGILITGTGVHYFLCNTNFTHIKYPDHSQLLYYCPVPTNNYDIVLSVPVANPQQMPPRPPLAGWGKPGNSNGPDETNPIKLRQHNVHKIWITLSGFSSGGTFAQQLHISHSSLFYGIATFSHAYYRCGPGTGSETDYDDACTIISANRTYDPELALADIREYEHLRLIDSTKNLKDQRLYVYAGTRSSFFDLDLSLTVVRIYEPFIKKMSHIMTRVQDATQLMPTTKYGAPCTEPASQDTLFVGKCGFSGAFEAVHFLLGNRIREPAENMEANLSNLMAFDQTEFLYGIEGNAYMDSVGYIYVPARCYSRKCYLHFYFHGCLTGREFSGSNHLINSGFLELAEANDLIIVAPQSISNQENTIGCWDTYGLTGKFYATKRGAQVTVVRNILARILGEDKNIDKSSIPIIPSLPNVDITAGPQSIRFPDVPDAPEYIKYP